MERRSFIKTALLAGGVFVLPGTRYSRKPKPGSIIFVTHRI